MNYGLLFLIGIFYNAWLFGLAALFGTIISTVTAHVLKYPKDDIKNGLYGFNGTLTGIAVTGLITLTVPFVLATWGVLMLKKVKI
ncbi:urea transporter [Bizionia sp. APA-3]|uniref:urea transporter n=1 Tax=Bizionia sp. APA-3 TaxID=1861784 RepID=UPI0021018678|nr:urea transporter [Bizionia sp. APA-3]